MFSKVEWDIVDTRVSLLRSDRGYLSKSISFLAIVIEQLFPNLQDQLLECITDGGGDRGVDGIVVLENEGSAEIYIFQSKYREAYDGCKKTINDPEVEKIIVFMRELFDQSESLENSHNFRLAQAVKRIWDIHRRGKICRYVVLFCSNGAGLSASASSIAGEFCREHQSVSVQYYGAESVLRGLHAERRRPESGSLAVIGREIFDRTDGDVRGAIASVDAMSFVSLIKTEDGYGIKRHLFDDNLRIFLGSKGGFNNQIIETATSDDSHLFWYLNNGITITCKKFSYNKGHANPTLVFDDFQIVNGAQTSHSLIEASRTKPDAISNVVVLVRIYETNREDIAYRVAVATNSQARIQSRDLKSNHPVLKNIEIAFLQRGYFFERKKGMFSDAPSDRRVDALKLGQIVLAYDGCMPDKAKTESDSIFDERFNYIFNGEMNAEYLVGLYEFYRIIEKMREEFIVEHGAFVEAGGPRQYLVYGHWFVLFAVRLLRSHDRWTEFPKEKEAEELINNAIALVSRACGRQKAVAHYQLFRSPRTIEKIYGELAGHQLSFFDDVGSWAWN